MDTGAGICPLGAAAAMSCEDCCDPVSPAASGCVSGLRSFDSSSASFKLAPVWSPAGIGSLMINSVDGSGTGGCCLTSSTLLSNRTSSGYYMIGSALVTSGEVAVFAVAADSGTSADVSWSGRSCSAYVA